MIDLGGTGAGLGLASVVLALLLAGCSGPAVRIDAQAGEAGFTRQEISGAGYSHVVYTNRRRLDGIPVLHVYLEGDGRPWRRPTVVARDPTPSRSLMLQLMAQDPAPALLLGRPCYFGLARRGRCNPWLWTWGRYGEPVVNSLAAALDRLTGGARGPELVLIGHSGGGALAMLLAPRLPRVRAVVTLAGNLDIDAWSARHGFTPLHGSLNPAAQPPLPARIRQWHFAGEADENVPPALVRAALAGQPQARVMVLTGIGHVEGWAERWPALLRRFAGAEE